MSVRLIQVSSSVSMSIGVSSTKSPSSSGKVYVRGIHTLVL